MRKTITYFVLILLFLKIVIRPVVGAIAMETPQRTLAAILTHFSVDKTLFTSAPIPLLDIAKKRSRRLFKPAPSQLPLFNVQRWPQPIREHILVEHRFFILGHEPPALVHPPA